MGRNINYGRPRFSEARFRQSEAQRVQVWHPLTGAGASVGTRNTVEQRQAAKRRAEAERWIAEVKARKAKR